VDGNGLAVSGVVSEPEARLKTLMLRGLAGDAAAHASLLSEMTGYLRGFFARRLGRDAADLEDLVQETLLAIHLKRETYDTALAFTSWAYSIARYKLIDQYRRNRVRRTEPLDNAGDLFASEDAEEGAVRHDLNRLMSSLPAKQRAVLEDVKISGLTNAEAARKAGMTETAVKVSIHRSLKSLMRRARDED
jgi:RNA polymerase sigma-70 factor (ECF subfamily)